LVDEQFALIDRKAIRVKNINAVILATLAVIPGTAQAQTQAQVARPTGFVQPAVFQAAGPTAASIQSTVDQYRAALGAVNNGNNPGPLAGGRREINWDGGGSTATSPGPTPFTVFLQTRGANITTPGTGFVQAPVDGLVTTFGNDTYATIFRPFSPVRLFSPVASNKTEVEFFVPGSQGTIAATTTGFGAVFADVDRPNGAGPFSNLASTFIEYFAQDGSLLFTAVVPASPGDAGLSFFGVVFSDARIARVRITAGNVAPGGNDGDMASRGFGARPRDIVVMDDFLYGEPQAIE
jgi:hypothetical protein